MATSLGRKLSTYAFGLSMSGHGPRALLTLRPGVRLTGEGGFQIAAPGTRKGDAPRSDDQGSGMEVSSRSREELLGTQASRGQRGQGAGYPEAVDGKDLRGAGGGETPRKP